jgi:EpsI family protein
MLQRHRFLWPALVLLLALAGSTWARRIEAAHLDDPAFLARLDPQFAGWPHTDVDLSPDEKLLLEPDAYLVRRFTSKVGEVVELAVIAGHRKRSIHTPGFCMVGGGWETVRQSQPALEADGRRIPTTQMLQVRENHTVLTTYFFTDGNFATNNLMRFQGEQLLKRFQSSVPLGAMVRIIAPVSTDPSRAEALTKRVAAEVLPGVLAGLRQRRLQTQ